MRIATFNLESLDDGPDVRPPLAARIAVLAPQLRRLDADILCLQEVNAQKPKGAGERRFATLAELLDAAGLSDMHMAASGNRADDGPADIHNIVTLSRFPILERRQIWHSFVSEPRHRYAYAEPPAEDEAILSWDRPVLYTRIAPGVQGPESGAQDGPADGSEDGSGNGAGGPPPGPVLHLYNVHLRAPLACPVPGQKTGAFAWKSIGGWAEGYYLSELKRAGQAVELRIALDKLFDAEPQALAAVAGDFNAEEGHTPVEIIRGEADNTGSGALEGGVMIPVEHSLAEDRRFTVIHQGSRQMLDHVLVSRALLRRYAGSEIHNEALADELVGAAAVDSSPVSYHAPVVAVFNL